MQRPRDLVPSMTAERQCGTHVPEALSGTLRPGTCTLVVGADGTHTGDHKAHLTIPKVGRVTFRWKGTRVRFVEGPPVVDLNEPTNPYLTGQMRKGPDCACPTYWKEQGQKMHHSPCVLV
jgi:hypothetical protein